MPGGKAVLENKTRKQIFNYISTYPGTSFGEIKDVFEINESTLKYHLAYLQRAEQIISKREGRRRLYYIKPYIDNNPLKISPAGHKNLTGNQIRIIKQIQNQPGISVKEIIKNTKLHRKTVAYNINKLIQHNIIWKVKSSDGIGYEYITEDKLRYEMYNQLLLKLIADEIDENTYLKIKKKLESSDIEYMINNDMSD